MAKKSTKSTKGKFLGLKPAYVTEEAWFAVIEAWENGLSDREAAFRASREGEALFTATEIKEWIKENPEIGELRAYLQDDLISQSKINVAGSIRKGNVKDSKWYLERKAADEFSTKSAVAFEGGVVAMSIEDKAQALEEMLKDFEDEDEQ